MQMRYYKKIELDTVCKDELERGFSWEVDCGEEMIEDQIITVTPFFEAEFTVRNAMTPANESPMFSIEKLFSMNNEFIFI